MTEQAISPLRCKIAVKQTRVGEIEAVDEREAIEKAATNSSRA
jgi:hypothetical protein